MTNETRERLAQLAKDHLSIETLKSRKSDSLDFHTLPVWQIEQALLAAYRAGMDPHWVIVAWAALFVAINLGHSCWLIYERYLQRLSAEEQSLYDCCFQALDRVSVRKLLRRGEWIVTEYSHKYDSEAIDRICGPAGFATDTAQIYSEDDGWFTV